MTREIKTGAPDCGLYLKAPLDLPAEKIIAELHQVFMAINHSAYEKNMHVLEVSLPDQGEAAFEKAEKFCDFAKQNGVVPILRGAPGHLERVGAEGILLENWDDYEQARGLCGDDGIVGLYCENDPEKAAAAFDLKADFVAFGTKNGALPSTEALQFWSMLTDFPAVIEGPLTNDYCAYYVQAGAGFLDGSDYIWNHPEGATKGTVNLLYAIELALEEKEKDASETAQSS